VAGGPGHPERDRARARGRRLRAGLRGRGGRLRAHRGPDGRAQPARLHRRVPVRAGRRDRRRRQPDRRDHRCGPARHQEHPVRAAASWAAPGPRGAAADRGAGHHRRVDGGRAGPADPGRGPGRLPGHVRQPVPDLERGQSGRGDRRRAPGLPGRVRAGRGRPRGVPRPALAPAPRRAGRAWRGPGRGGDRPGGNAVLPTGHPGHPGRRRRAGRRPAAVEARG
jgi:hypothetical protein